MTRASRAARSMAVRSIHLTGMLVTLATAATALAHGLEPASLALRETTTGVFEVTWRASALRLPGANVQPVLPERCRSLGPLEADDTADTDRITLRWTVDCGTPELAGETIEITDLGAAKINALLTIDRLVGPPVQTILSPRHTAYVFAAEPSRLDVVREYARLGMEHILGGPDHLLFVFALLLLVSSFRTLLATVTAFTVGHSITLSAAVLGIATVPQRPVEILIALSILVLAVELTRDDPQTWMRRAPWIMALLFGLLHGFGFAGALTEAGLPSEHIPVALAAFNGGIEIAQLAFVAGVLLLRDGLRRSMPALTTRGARPVVYATGILAAFWCYERVALWLA